MFINSLVALLHLFLMIQAVHAIEHTSLPHLDEAITYSWINELNELYEKRDCLFSTEFSTIPQTISTSGYYCLVNDVTVGAAQTAITINVDNVILDLNGNSIIGNFVGPFAITVNSKSNIIIRNGAIRTMTGNAILVNAGTSRLIIEDIICINNNNAITIQGVTNCLIQNCSLFLTNFNGLSISSGTIPTQNLIIRNCVSNNNQNNGFLLSSCSNAELYNLTANNNRGSGFNQVNGNNINFTRCTANTNQAHGFTIAGNSNNTTLTACTAKSNNNIGFQLAGNQHTITECESVSNGSGVQVSGKNHCIFNSIAKNNTATGFLLNADCTQCQMRNNSALANNIGIQNNGTFNRIYANFSSDNVTANFVGVPNTFVSPTAISAINSTANIDN